MADETGNGAPRPVTYKGRRRIYSEYPQVTADNVAQVISDSMAAFGANRAQESYLWSYYRGRQPILDRVKDVRPEINNRIVENHAKETVDFKVGYQLAEPVQYVSRTGENEDEKSEQIKTLNTLMYADGKPEKDHDLFEWMCVCGVGYRLVTANQDAEAGDAPFRLYTLDPRQTFVVLSSEFHHRPLAAVWVAVAPVSHDETFNVYTPDAYYRVEGGRVIDQAPNALGGIPIVEYELNSSRQGVFEPALPILDAINAVASNRMDSIEQTVQSLMKFVNCDIDRETFAAMLELGAVKVRSVDGLQGDVDFITNDLDQTQTQVTKDDLYQALANIVGMPNTNGTSGSSSDTGTAVLLRDGWTLAESHAKGYELKWKAAEREVLRVVLRICSVSDEPVDLTLRDIEMAFNRRNYENALVKSQVLTTMLSNDRIDPELAFQHSGLFTDPEAAYLQSKRHYEAVQAENQRKAELIAAGGAQGAGDGRNAYNDDMAEEAQRRNAVRRSVAES